MNKIHIQIPPPHTHKQNIYIYTPMSWGFHYTHWLVGVRSTTPDDDAAVGDTVHLTVIVLCRLE